DDRRSVWHQESRNELRCPLHGVGRRGHSRTDDFRTGVRRVWRLPVRLLCGERPGAHRACVAAARETDRAGARTGHVDGWGAVETSVGVTLRALAAPVP